MQVETSPAIRVNVWFIGLALTLIVFGLRLFQIQVLQRSHYRQLALSSQLKEYQIPATRGTIEAYDGDRVVPFVLNEKKYTLFADPIYINEPAVAAEKVAEIIGGNKADYEQKMRADTRYSVLAKKLNLEQKTKLDALEIKGLGTREALYRTYPQGEMAAQMLGFVNDDGEGKYGVEQFFDEKLRGKPGELKAITDASGTPLFANKDNIIKEPQPGSKVVLTLDISMQKQVEEILKKGLEHAKSQSGSVIVIDPNSGAVKAMTTYPAYNPGDYASVSDPATFINPIAGQPMEVGSVMKPLTFAAGLDLGAIKTTDTYYDPASETIDTHAITNVAGTGGPGTRSVKDILVYSLNTGAIHILKQIGGGQLNENGREKLHNYFVNHYQFGKLTGIEQGYEAEGYVPHPKEGYGLNITYANMTFGQALNVTPIQYVSALSSIVNGGTYWKPYVVDYVEDGEGNKTQTEPQKVKENVVSEQVSSDIRSIMVDVLKNSPVKMPHDKYLIGGKTGTAQIPKSGGGYIDGVFNGTFVGFVGGSTPQYVIFVKVDRPKISILAGSQAARPIFVDTVNMLINNFNVAQAN